MTQPRSLQSLAVFCGSSPGSRPAYREAAKALGRAMVERGITLVYGGGNVGLMGVIADEVIDRGGKAIGVIPEKLLRRELGSHRLTELHVVDSMHTRKAMMAERADAFVAMPGGFGTFEEIFEIITWSQLGLHSKPKTCGLLNIEGFYDPMITMIDHAVAEGFIQPQHRAIVLASSDPETLLDRLATEPVPPVYTWIDPSST